MTEKRRPRPDKKTFEEFRTLRAKALKKNYDDPIRSSYVDMHSKFDMSSEVFKGGEKYGIKNAINEVVLEPKYDNFKTMTDEVLDTGDYVVAELDKMWGILSIDGVGNWKIDPEYDYIGYPNQITHMKKGDKWRIMNIDKNEVLVDDCDAVDDNMGFCFSNGVCFFQRNGKHGVMMQWGQHTDAVFDDIEFDPDLYVKVLYNGKWGYVDEKNEFTEEMDDAYYVPLDL